MKVIKAKTAGFCFGVKRAVDTVYKHCPRGEEVEISKPTSRVKVFVIPTDEEMMIARDTAALTAK